LFSLLLDTLNVTSPYVLNKRLLAGLETEGDPSQQLKLTLPRTDAKANAGQVPTNARAGAASVLRQLLSPATTKWQAYEERA
jgi:hypothetical protein